MINSEKKITSGCIIIILSCEMHRGKLTVLGEYQIYFIECIENIETSMLSTKRLNAFCFFTEMRLNFLFVYYTIHGQCPIEEADGENASTKLKSQIILVQIDGYVLT